MTRFAALAASALAACLLAGCAGPSSMRGAPPAGLTWGGYLYGEDLRRTCSEEGPDRYRFVVNAARPGQPVRIFEAVGSAAEGGTIEVRDLPIGRVADIGPGEPYRGPGPDPDGAGSDRLRLSPAQFAALGEGLVVRGTLLPPSLAPDVTRGTGRWFATGCHGGFYFVSTSPGRLPPSQEVGLRGRVNPPRR